jgi:hypothetical protein
VGRPAPLARASRWSSTRSRWRWLAPYRGPGFQTGRYSAHLLPLAVVVALLGLERFLPGSPRGSASRSPSRSWPGSPCGCPAEADAYAWGVQNINAMQVTLGRWVAARRPPDTLIALNDVGALAYFGQRRVIDLVGLATPEILPYRRQGPTAVLRYLDARARSTSSSSPNGSRSSPRAGSLPAAHRGDARAQLRRLGRRPWSSTRRPGTAIGARAGAPVPRPAGG